MPRRRTPSTPSGRTRSGSADHSWAVPPGVNRHRLLRRCLSHTRTRIVFNLTWRPPWTVGRLLEVLVQHLAGDAPGAVALAAAPDHEKASPHRRGIRAFRPAHPGRTPDRRREVAGAERRLRCDLHRGDADVRGGVEERASSLE